LYEFIKTSKLLENLPIIFLSINIFLTLKNFLKKKTNKSRITEFKIGKDKNFSLFQIEGKRKDQLVKEFSKIYENDSQFSKSGGAISSKSILSLVGLAGLSVAGSSALSSNLFVATADASTLMKMGQGVGSAVMGSTGIARQAAFLPVAGVHIAFPVIVFQVLTTLTSLKHFNVVNKKLDILNENTRRIIQRTEADFAGKIIFSNKQLDNLDNQLMISKQFTPEMRYNLFDIQSKIGPVFERYKILYEFEKIDKNISRLKQKHWDSLFLIASSILDIKIDLFKIKLALQDSPEQLKFLENNFLEKCQNYKKLWTKIKEDPKLAQMLSEDLSDTIDNMNFWERNIPSFLGGKRNKKKEMEVASKHLKQHSKEIKASVDSMVGIGENFLENVGSLKSNISLIYWKDQLGEHSIYLNDINNFVKKDKV